MNLTPGVSANFGKTGGSLSIGPRGCKTTFGKKGVRTTVGIPGTGLSSSAYRPYRSKRKPSSTSSSGQTIIVPIRSRQSNTAWGLMFLVLSLATIIFSFTYPNLIYFGRWVISIICGGFFLLGAIIFFTAKSREDYQDDIQEEFNQLDDMLNNLEEKIARIKSSAEDVQKTVLSSEDIDFLLEEFFKKKQEYHNILTLHLKNIKDLEVKEKALLVWGEMWNQVEILDNIEPQMLPRQREYYKVIRPTESYIQN